MEVRKTALKQNLQFIHIKVDLSLQMAQYIIILNYRG